jgi:ProP effector
MTAAPNPVRLSASEIERRRAAVAALHKAARARRGEVCPPSPAAAVEAAGADPPAAAGPAAVPIAGGAADPNPGPGGEASPPNRGNRRRAAALAALAVFRARYPAVFGKPVPLAIGVFAELVAIFAEEMAVDEISLALVLWTRRRGYQRALAAGGERRRLDGTPAGRVSDEHRALAAAWLAAHDRGGAK